MTNIMPIIFVLILGVFWCGVQASQLSFDSFNKECNESKPKVDAVVTPDIRVLNRLKYQRHRLRMRLESKVRTRSIAPPTGEIRSKLEENLLHIENAIKELHNPSK
jgi:hypothetical protein